LKNKNLSVFSILLSFTAIILIVYINYQIAKEYLRVDGKTRALFGIKEILQFSYQYYVIIIGFLALGIALIIRNPDKQKSIALALSLGAIILVFCRLWRFFVFLLS
jgi:hypothetical protein